MADPAPKPEQAASRKAACIHCGYDLRETPVDGKCPECGNPATDTREGTLFYRLPPTRLGTITAGAALTCVVHTVCAVSALLDLARWLISAGMSADLTPIFDALAYASQYLYAPWIALFMLAAPLNRLSTWGSVERIFAIAATAAFVLLQTGYAYHYRVSPPTGMNVSVSQIVHHVAESMFAYLPILLSCVQLQKVARRLPGSPFASLGALSIVCSLVLLARTGIESGGLVPPSAIPQTGLAVITLLLWGAPTVFPFVVYRELRAVARDVDADHPYTRI